MSEDALAMLGRSYAPAVQRRLGRLAEREQSQIASWLLQNPIGTNLALGILEQLEDLARRDSASPANLLLELYQAQPRDRLQPKEIGRRLRDELQRRLHPESGAHREAFAEWQSSLKLPESVQVKPPQNFEGKNFTLEIAFDSTLSLRERLQAALETLKRAEWEKIWKF